MNRREFMKVGAIGVGTIAMPGCFQSCKPNPPTPMKAAFGNGVADPFMMMWYGQMTVRMNLVLDAYSAHPKIKNSTIRLLLSHKFTDKSGKTWGRQWGVYQSFSDPTTPFNQPFFDKLRWYVQECNNRGVTVCITLFDGNWVSMDPFTTHYGKGYSSISSKVNAAYSGALKPLQKTYIDKVMATLDGLAYYIEPINEKWYGAVQGMTVAEALGLPSGGDGDELLHPAGIPEITVVANIASHEPSIMVDSPLPSDAFCQSVINYVKTKKPDCLITVWKQYTVTGYNKRTVHSAAEGCGTGWICNEEKQGGEWGGNYPAPLAVTFVNQGDSVGRDDVLAFWEWVWSNGVFAPSQLQAFK